MQERILRKLFLGFVHIHILHHADQSPIYGAWMLEELETHGYHMSPGTLYPILHQMAQMNLLQKTDQVVAGKLRKYYRITDEGKVILSEAKKKVQLMHQEINL
jgi:DNA-binding PadR family transcriptional regulator